MPSPFQDFVSATQPQLLVPFQGVPSANERLLRYYKDDIHGDHLDKDKCLPRSKGVRGYMCPALQFYP